jgi:hypothetical protein
MSNIIEKPGELVPPRARNTARFQRRNKGCLDGYI